MFIQRVNVMTVVPAAMVIAGATLLAPRTGVAAAAAREGKKESESNAKIEQPVWGTPLKGLRLGLCRTEARADGKPRLRVVLDNAGTDDLVLNLGEMFGFGKKQAPQAIRLVFTDAGGKKRTLLRSRGPIDEKVGALVSPLVVPLPAGGRYAISCDLADYFDAKDVTATLAPGRYRARAVFVGRAVTRQDTSTGDAHLASMPYWTGSIQSDECQVTLPAKQAK